MIFASATKVQPANQNLGSYAIVESGVNSLGVTTTGSVPAVTQSPFADLYKEGSVYFNGVAGNYLSNTAVYSNVGIAWQTTGITIEAWVNYPTFVGASQQGAAPTGIQIPGLVCYGSPSSFVGNPAFGSNINGYVTFYYYNGSYQTVTAQTQLSANTWNHIAVSVAPSGPIYMFINGVQSQVIADRNGSFITAAASETVQGTPSTSFGQLVIGQFNSLAVNAYVADLRLTTGAGLYTGSPSGGATFTVPSAPLSSTTSPGVTQFLLRAGQNSPTIQNGALTFDRGLKQFMNFGAQTFNIATRGFSIVFRYTWNGTATLINERIFQASVSKSDQNNSIYITRNGTANQLNFGYVLAGVYSPNAVSATGIAQGTTYVASIVYNPNVGSGTAQWWINGAPSGSPVTGLASSITTDHLCPFAFMGCDFSGAGNFGQFTSNTLAIYNRALSNVEIYNSYLALTTSTVNAPIEIGDVNGTPALSIAGDGRVNVTKLGQTSNVLPWPPAAMTGYDTLINGGVYKVRASSDQSFYLAWQAFNKQGSTGSWATGASENYTATGVFLGTTTFSDVNGSSYLGAWLQIQLPSSITLSNYSLTANATYYANFSPTTFSVLGSRDGTNWTLVDSRYSVTWASVGPQTFTTASVQSYPYYRISVQKLNGGGGGSGSCLIGQWILNGTNDTAQTLTVAQPVTLSYGAQTASLTGISGDKYVPQDFSSSGLNVPAYVVSNTATVANTVAFSSFGPFAGEGSLYFGGGNSTSGYVQFPSSVTSLNFDITLQDITIEFWVYAVRTAQPGPFIFRGPTPGSATSEWQIYQDGSGMVFQAASTSTSPTTNKMTINQWNHVAATIQGSTMTLWLNGTSIGTVSKSTSTYNSAYPVAIGAGNYSTYYNGYISNLRMTRGQALYTTSFTPPTGPLQPIQGTTQAGLPYGTVLLLRNAPAPGRVLTSKFGGANSGGVNGAPLTLPFPPAAMTSYAVSLSSGYGQGVYVASASGEFSTSYAWLAFNKAFASSACWQYGGYNSAGNTNTGVTTVDVNGTSYAGDWLQIQLASSIVLSNYQMLGSDYAAAQSPLKFWILGSRDGTNWYLVDSRTVVQNSFLNTYTVSSGQSFTYFRCVVNQIGASVIYVQITEWTLNGTIEGLALTQDGRLGLGVTNPTQALEVAGSAVVAGTLSAGNPLMFRNRIINGDMRIAQRGTSTSLVSGTNAFSADRAVVYSAFSPGAATLYQNTLSVNDAPYQQGLRYAANVTVTSTLGSSVFLTGQVLEGWTVQDFNWGTAFGSPITISYWFKSGVTGTFGYGLRNSGINTVTFTGSFTYSTAGIWQYVTYTIPPPPTGYSWQTGTSAAIECFVGGCFQGSAAAGWNTGGPNLGSAAQATWYTTGGYIAYTGVQLEKGSVATPYEIRPYATELALCQRYYQQFQGTSDPYHTFALGQCVSGTQAWTYFRFLQPMRVPPTLTSNAVSNFTLINAAGNTAYPLTALAINVNDSSGVECARLDATASTAVLTAGNATILRGNNTTLGYIGLNAEL
jgi:hypothetical protein